MQRLGRFGREPQAKAEAEGEVLAFELMSAKGPEADILAEGAESCLGYSGDVIGLGQPCQSGGAVLAARAAASIAIAARAAP